MSFLVKEPALRQLASWRSCISNSVVPRAGDFGTPEILP